MLSKLAGKMRALPWGILAHRCARMGVPVGHRRWSHALSPSPGSSYNPMVKFRQSWRGRAVVTRPGVCRRDCYG